MHLGANFNAHFELFGELADDDVGLGGPVQTFAHFSPKPLFWLIKIKLCTFRLLVSWISVDPLAAQGKKHDRPTLANKCVQPLGLFQMGLQVSDPFSILLPVRRDFVLCPRRLSQTHEENWAPRWSGSALAHEDLRANWQVALQPWCFDAYGCCATATLGQLKFQFDSAHAYVAGIWNLFQTTGRSI